MARLPPPGTRVKKHENNGDILMVNLVVLLIVAGCVAFQLLKGTFFNALATFIVALCASIVAFAYFEILANVIIGYEILIPWAQTLSFALLFILAFAVLQTLATQLSRQPVDLGLLPERIGCVVSGILLGLVLSSLLITALAMAPIPNNYPYQRFDQRSPDAERPNTIFFNSDALASGLFSTVSKGSLSGKRSFAALHPAFLDQLFLNRHNIAQNVPIITTSPAIQVPAKQAAWSAPEGIKDTDDNPISPKSDHVLMFVRVGFNKAALGDAGNFTPAQLRLICKPQSDVKDPLAGKGKNIYPIGYLAAGNTIQIKRLNEVIKLTRDDFPENAREKWIDFAFNVPSADVPVLLEFKQNCIVQVPERKKDEQPPQPIPFVPAPEKQKPTTTKPDTTSRPQRPAKPRRPQKTSEGGGGLSPITRPLVGPQLDDYK
jgi:hypothetical protein